MSTRVVFLIGPAGAGKSTYAAAHYPKEWVVSSDEIRQQLTGNFEDQSRNRDVFKVVRNTLSTRVQNGLVTVLDATNLRKQDRQYLHGVIPESVPVEYVLIDRPLIEKNKTGGWRNTVTIGALPLIEYHHLRFEESLKDILSGDDLPNVRVIDKRR